MHTAAQGTGGGNAEAVRGRAAAEPALVDIRLAGDALPDFKGQILLHAGPPVAYACMCPPMRSAAEAGGVYEGWAPDLRAARSLLRPGGGEPGRVPFAAGSWHDDGHHHTRDARLRRGERGGATQRGVRPSD